MKTGTKICSWIVSAFLRMISLILQRFDSLAIQTIPESVSFPVFSSDNKKTFSATEILGLVTDF